MEHIQQKNNKQAPIGVFDSGLGGLTVAREIMRNLPNEKIVYFGDTARVPYGSKSKQTVERYARQIVRFLKTQKIKAIVAACNTATAAAFDAIREEAGDMPVIGVIDPGAITACRETKTKKVGVIATRATITSGAYERAIRNIDPEVRVIAEACPLLVPLVEEGWIRDEITDAVIMRYLEPLLADGIDALILGCTHYPLLRSEFRRLAGEEIALVNPAYETARSLKELLSGADLLNGEEKHPDEPTPYRFFVSDEAERFAEFANSILPVDVRAAELIAIENY